MNESGTFINRSERNELIRDVYARICYPQNLELGRLNWEDMGGSEPSDERAEWELAFEPVFAAITPHLDREQVEK